MCTMLQNDPANAFHGAPVFFLRKFVAKLTHILHGKLLTFHTIHPKNDQSLLSILQVNEAAFCSLNSQALGHVHGEMLQLRHFGEFLHRGFQDVPAL